MTLFKICRIDDIKDNSMILAKAGSKEIVVGKRNGIVFSCDAHCPHRYAYLHRGRFNENNIVCPLHEYEFDICTGKLMKMRSWAEGQNGWIEQNEEWRKSGDLPIYRVEVHDGYIYVEL